jgi:2-phosphosulfolactate phosphatase
LQLHVFFTPTEVTSVNAWPDGIYIVVDVIRATTTLTVMLDQGAKRVLIANTLEQARQAAQAIPDLLLCGERNALPPPGFDYGNSPAQFSRTDLRERQLVLTTTNGTRAFFACPQQSTRLAGCFYNAHAVTAHAIALARQEDRQIAIVCAGERGYFALDDTVCAGYLALEILRQQPDVQADESVTAAIALYHAYSPPALLDHCHSAQSVIAAGLQEDLAFCIQPNASASIPIITGNDPATGLLVVE